jgi:fluoroquinolone resistance protein
MQTKNYENTTFEKVIFSEKEAVKRSFEGCTFLNCDLSDSNLNNNEFIDCAFISCNMSNTKLRGAHLKTVSFKDSKLIGINFNECQDFLFHADFENCVLDYTSFVGKKITKTKFNSSSLKGADFSNTDLSESSFDNCNLSGTVFNKTILKNTDFRTAHNFNIDPDINFIKKAKFSKNSLEGLLTKYDLQIDQ